MAKYNVCVTRVSYACRDIIVDADTPELAREKALEEAGDYEFSEHDADYSVSDTAEIIQPNN